MSTTHVSPSLRITVGARVRTYRNAHNAEVAGTVTDVNGDFVTVEFDPATSYLRGATMLASEVIIVNE